MYNAAKSISIVILTVAIACSCSDKDKQQATNLLSQANEALAEGDWNSAMTLIDSIDHTYPRQVDIRRKAMHLRAKAMETESLLKLQSTDSLLAVSQIAADSIMSGLTRVDNPVEPYYVAAGSTTPSAFMSENSIQGRMTPEGIFYIVSSLAPANKYTAISLSDDYGNEVRTLDVAMDGERNSIVEGRQIITFMPSECDTLGVFATQNSDKKLQLRFLGSPAKTVTLQPKSVSELASIYQASKAVWSLKKTALEKERLTKQLDIARSQMARTYETNPQE